MGRGHVDRGDGADGAELMPTCTAIWPMLGCRNTLEEGV